MCRLDVFRVPFRISMPTTVALIACNPSLGRSGLNTWKRDRGSSKSEKAVTRVAAGSGDCVAFYNCCFQRGRNCEKERERERERERESNFLYEFNYFFNCRNDVAKQQTKMPNKVLRS